MAPIVTSLLHVSANWLPYFVHCVAKFCIQAAQWQTRHDCVLDSDQQAHKTQTSSYSYSIASLTGHAMVVRKAQGEHQQIPFLEVWPLISVQPEQHILGSSHV